MTAVRPSLLLDFAKTRALDPRITFTRASTATYYDGKTWAKAEENLLLRSQDFSASWVATNLTPVAGKTAPDGASTATEFTAAAANGTLTQSVTALAGDYTFSVWLRRVTGTGNVDISAHSDGTWVTQTLTSTWARFTVTQTLTAGARTPGIRVVTSGDVIEVWGAQMELRAAVTAYTPTTTQPITNYVPVLQTAAAGVARFDHDPVTVESLGLLIEEQRTNLLTYSEDFTNAVWTKIRSSISSNAIVAPDGTITADKLIENTSASTSYFVISSVTSTATLAHTFSVYIKAAERTQVAMQIDNGITTGGLGLVNLNTLAVTSITGSGSPVFSVSSVGNGWVRIALTAVPGASGTTVRFIVYLASNGINVYTGDGYSGVYIWGAQLEAGAFPTSYIKTEGSQVTRSADSASMTGTNFSSWYRQDEGTLYLGYRQEYSQPGNKSIFSVDSGSTSNQIIFLTASGPDRALFYTDARGSNQTNINAGNMILRSYMKQAATYKINAFSMSVNSGNIAVDSLALVPQGITNAKIGASLFSGWNGYIQRIAYYPKSLTNAQLQALTR